MNRITPTATLNPPVPAFTPPADAVATLRLTQADINLLRAALASHLTHQLLPQLIDAWGERGKADALTCRMRHLDTLNATLLEIATSLA